MGDDFSSGSVEAGKAITPRIFFLSRLRWGAEDDDNTVEGQLEFALTRRLFLQVVMGDKLVGRVELVGRVLY